MLNPSLPHVQFFHFSDTCSLGSNGSTKFLKSLLSLIPFERAGPALVLKCYVPVPCFLSLVLECYVQVPCFLSLKWLPANSKAIYSFEVKSTVFTKLLGNRSRTFKILPILKHKNVW
jgi:hypothetical protein